MLKKIKRDAPVAKAKDEMIKPLAWLHACPRDGIIRRGAGISLIKPPKPRGIGVSPLKKTQSILVFDLVLAIKRLYIMKTF